MGFTGDGVIPPIRMVRRLPSSMTLVTKIRCFTLSMDTWIGLMWLKASMLKLATPWDWWGKQVWSPDLTYTLRYASEKIVFSPPVIRNYGWYLPSAGGWLVGEGGATGGDSLMDK